MFVVSCDVLAEHRAILSASDGNVAIYLQSVMINAKTFAPVKAASTMSAFFQKINLFDHEPTQSSAACVVRSVSMQKFGLNTKNRKKPFEWNQFVDFTKACVVRHQGYCHLVVAAMAVVMLGRIRDVQRRVRTSLEARPHRGGWERI